MDFLLRRARIVELSWASIDRAMIAVHAQPPSPITTTDPPNAAMAVAVRP